MELLPNFKLHRPKDLSSALKLKSNEPHSRYLAGGTDLVVNIRRGIEQPKNLIDLTSIEEVQEIEETKSGLAIGSGVTLNRVRDSAVVQESYPAVADAAKAIAGPTHQQYGTVGGNICLDTRCLFYNQSEWWRKSNDYCLKERGEICHVAPGGKRCFAAFSGDLSPALLVHGAKVEIFGKNGAQEMDLKNIYKNDGLDHLNLQEGEFVTRVILPKSTANQKSRYKKSRIRGSIDFPLAGTAVRISLDKKKTVSEISIALTAVNPYPQIVSGLEKLMGKKIGKVELNMVQEMVQKQAKPMRTTTVSPWYRRRVVGSISKKLVNELYSELV